MASIENRSRFKVSVPRKQELTRLFRHNEFEAAQAYAASLQALGHKPKADRLDEQYIVRVRQVGFPDQAFAAKSEQEALDIQARVESERRQGLFIDYNLARRTSFADLLKRYLVEEAPRHKGFIVEAYRINAVLEDAGLERVDIAQAYADHKNPHPALANKRFPKPTGRQMRTTSEVSRFIRKSFAVVGPDDFQDYVDDLRQYVSYSTAARTLDLFSATCRIAIDKWRIPIHQSPMDGFKREPYFNERDRRLKPGEEERLLDAARAEDRRQAIQLRLEQLLDAAHADAAVTPTRYGRRKARDKYEAIAADSYEALPMMETIVQFQLMTGARRSETLGVLWKDIDFDDQTAFLPETKNGRPRKLPLRRDLVELLQALPRTSDRAFPMSVDALRDAWERICETGGFVGEHALHFHDLRHEAISRVAEASRNVKGGFSMLDLQAFSGHRDIRMLVRYTHLCVPSLAKRLDLAFRDDEQHILHRGQRRLRKRENKPGLTMAEVVLNSTQPEMPLPGKAIEDAVQQNLPTNVVAFRPRRAA